MRPRTVAPSLARPIRSARHLLLWDGLAPGGLLVLGNFNGHHPMHHFTESALDWYLVYRDPEDLLRLVDGLPGVTHLEVRTEDTGCLHLYTGVPGGSASPARTRDPS